MQTKSSGTKRVFHRRKRSNAEIRPLARQHQKWLSPQDYQYARSPPPVKSITKTAIVKKPLQYDADRESYRYEKETREDAYNLSTTEDERVLSCPHFEYEKPPCNDYSCIYYLAWKRERKHIGMTKPPPK